MIDHFVLKYGVKIEVDKNSYCYALKGKVYIFLPAGNNYWNIARNNNTQQPFCIEKIFNCAINKNLHNNTYEVFHRGHTCSNEKTCNVINQCYAYDASAINENWFSDEHVADLANNLNLIPSQQSETDTLNNRAINKYYTTITNDQNYASYTDCFKNYVRKVTNLSVTIRIPPMQNRQWAMEIVLQKPVKLNLT